MTNFNERTNTLLYKNIISYTLFSKGLMLVECERWVKDGDRLLFWPKVLLTIAALLPHLGWVARPWVIEGPKVSVCRWLSLQHLVPNWLQLARTASGTWLYNCPPTSTVLPVIYTGASLDWRLGRVSICYRILTRVNIIYTHGCVYFSMILQTHSNTHTYAHMHVHISSQSARAAEYTTNFLSAEG